MGQLGNFYSDVYAFCMKMKSAIEEKSVFRLCFILKYLRRILILRQGVLQGVLMCVGVCTCMYVCKFVCRRAFVAVFVGVRVCSYVCVHRWLIGCIPVLQRFESRHETLTGRKRDFYGAAARNHAFNRIGYYEQRRT